MRSIRVCLALCLFLSINAFAYDAKIDGIFYDLEEKAFPYNEATVTFSSSNYDYSGDVVIPDYVLYDGRKYIVTTIDQRAFWDCTKVTSVYIPASLTKICGNGFLDSSLPENPFGGCSMLENITVAADNPRFDSRNNCNALVQTKYSDSAKCDNYLISGCKNTIIPKGITEIGDYAFSGCRELTSIDIPEGVTRIGNRAFLGCSGLTSITIPNSVTSIGNGAFSSCTGLTSITIPNSVTSIGYGAFHSCTGLTSITIPNSVTSIGNGAFSGTPWYNNQPNGLVYAGNVVIDYKGTMHAEINLKDGTTGIGSQAFSGCGLTAITIPNSVTHIGDYAFYNCSGLTSVSIPNSVTSIGSESFKGCTGLTSVIIEGTPDINSNKPDLFSETPWYRNQPNGVVYAGNVVIGYKGTMPAFTEINLKDGTTGIGCCAFHNCGGLTSVTIPNSVTSIGNSAFRGCNGLTSVTIPNSVTSIGNSAFEGCCSLTAINIPNGVTNIGDYTFYGCSGLTAINIPNGVTNIGDYTFYGCSGLTAVSIPNSVTSIGYGTFSKCTGLTAINIPNGVTSIGNSAFSGCSGLTSINIPNGVTNIGDSAFRGCSGLTSINIPNGVTNIGDFTFCYCSGLTAVSIPNGVTSIGNSAFEGCGGLTSITIPNSVKTINHGAFDVCTHLKAVHINNLTSWCSIKFKYKSPNSGTTKLATNPLYHARHLFLNGVEVTELVIPNDVTTLGGYSFINCNGLSSVTISTNLTSIEEDAFYGCDSIRSLTINCQNVDKWFTNKRSIQYLKLGEGVTSIRDGAFFGCSGLISISIASENTIYDSRNKCNAIIETSSKTLITGCKNTIIPNNVTSIGQSAFTSCSGLTSVSIPNSVTSIGNSAFRNCSSLTAVSIPNSVTHIGDYAFYNCNGLKSVAIGISVTSIGNSAFRNCSSLTEVYCYAEKVPTTDSYAFYSSPISSATLHVPAGSLEAYKTTKPWSFFGTIVESPIIDFTDDNVKTLCVANWDTNGDEELSEAEAAAVTDLGTVFRNNKLISSFDELKYFTGLTSINYNAFRGCTGLTSIIIPEKVTSIGGDAFSGCTSLTSITIPASVTSIGDFALSNCSKLKTVYCYAEAVPSASDDTFDGTNIGAATLYVPKVSLTLYRNTAPWSGFGAIVPIEGYTTYNINDDMASLSIATEESGCNVTFKHDFNGEWEALYLPFAIDYDAIKAEFDLAEIDGVVQNDNDNDGTMDFTVLSIQGFKEQMTKPNKPYLIRAKNTGEQTINFEDVTVYPTQEVTFDCSSFTTRYDFTGSYNALDASALADRYIVQDGELVTGVSSLAPCRWYMTATARNGAALNLPNKIRIMPVEDVITGVKTLSDSPLKGENIIYNLAGQQMGNGKLQKGINIKNGRKVLIR